MLSIKYYLSQPFKDGVTKEDIKALKKANKPIGKYLNDRPTVIYLFITFTGRKLVRVNSREKVKGIYWNTDKNCAVPQMHGALELNDRLQFIKAEIIRQYRKAITNSPSITLAQVKELAENVVANNVPDFNQRSLLVCLEEFIKEREFQIDGKTTRKFKTVVNLLTWWMKLNNIKSGGFFCDEVDDSFELSFKNYLVKDRAITNNTISKYLECIKTFMKWARKKGYHKSNSFEDFGVAKTRSEIIWISEDELTQLINYEPIDKHVRRTRLVFLFMLYTAQRYSDYRHVRRKDVVVNPDGTVDWHLFQRKQSKTFKVVVPIIEPAVEILDQFEFRQMQPNDFVVPITCNQSFNRSIKKLCKLGGLDTPVTTVRIVGNKRIEQTFKKYELLSCHTSRKSWVSLSLEKGLGPDYLASVTGHTNLKTLRNHYVGLNHESKRKAINAAWKTPKM